MIPESEFLDKGLIVSVQAPQGSPMNDSYVIAAMADAALRKGAVGVRVESPDHIGAVRRRCPQALIIGIWKCMFPESSVYITPGWREIKGVWSAGADIIAIDATARTRPDGQKLENLVKRTTAELNAPLMADVDSIENGLRAVELGFEWVGTTLYGYTEETSDFDPPGIHLLPELRQKVDKSVRVICEGGLNSPALARDALKAGADNVVIGSAITGLDLLVDSYCKGIAI